MDEKNEDMGEIDTTLLPFFFLLFLFSVEYRMQTYEDLGLIFKQKNEQECLDVMEKLVGEIGVSSIMALEDNSEANLVHLLCGLPNLTVIMNYLLETVLNGGKQNTRTLRR
jgi:hypothetical protein